MSKKRIAWHAWCAFLAALNFAAGALTDSWVNYALGGVLVALTAANLYFDKQRKAEPTVATNPNWINLAGSISSGPISFHTSTTPAPEKPGEFKGLPFDLTLGEVYGLRMWRVDHYGRLRARNWSGAEPWRPGVNVARCVPDKTITFENYFRRAVGQPPVDEPEPKPPHDAPSENCQCGFYAYTDDRHAETLPYKQTGEDVVLGVIKGTGRTLIGTKGFRCEKAEIVALRDPTRGGTKNDPWRLRQRDDLARVYRDIPLLPSRAALLEFAPLTDTRPDPSTDEFWSLP